MTPRTRMERIVSVSGGKDSTALYLYALERQVPFMAVFADTGNEAPETYDYLHELPEKTGGPAIRWIRAFTEERVRRKARNLQRVFDQTGQWGEHVVTKDQIETALSVLKPTGIPFLDESLSRGGFPSFERRFCTDKLKIEPMCRQVYQPLLDLGAHIVSWQGVRAEESPKRSVLPMRQRQVTYDARFHIFRPLLLWKEHEVFAYIRRHGLKPNPLYEKGATRVGCWPCIFIKKKELRMLAVQDPVKIDTISQWEDLTGLATPLGCSAFLNPKNLRIPGPFHHSTHGIHQQVDWSKTAHGGRQYELLFDARTDVDAHGSEVCTGHGLCE